MEQEKPSLQVPRVSDIHANLRLNSQNQKSYIPPSSQKSCLPSSTRSFISTRSSTTCLGNPSLCKSIHFDRSISHSSGAREKVSRFRVPKIFTSWGSDLHWSSAPNFQKRKIKFPKDNEAPEDSICEFPDRFVYIVRKPRQEIPAPNHFFINN